MSLISLKTWSQLGKCLSLAQNLHRKTHGGPLITNPYSQGFCGTRSVFLGYLWKRGSSRHFRYLSVTNRPKWLKFGPPLVFMQPNSNPSSLICCHFQKMLSYLSLKSCIYTSKCGNFNCRQFDLISSVLLQMNQKSAS